eukprot:1540263-Prymnesium_polylepis.1
MLEVVCRVLGGAPYWVCHSKPHLGLCHDKGVPLPRACTAATAAAAPASPPPPSRGKCAGGRHCAGGAGRRRDCATRSQRAGGPPLSAPRTSYGLPMTSAHHCPRSTAPRSVPRPAQWSWRSAISSYSSYSTRKARTCPRGGARERARGGVRERTRGGARERARDRARERARGGRRARGGWRARDVAATAARAPLAGCWGALPRGLVVDSTACE